MGLTTGVIQAIVAAKAKAKASAAWTPPESRGTSGFKDRWTKFGPMPAPISAKGPPLCIQQRLERSPCQLLHSGYVKHG
eukprot:s2013_g14.t1